jgi:N-glycosidase YbiA
MPEPAATIYFYGTSEEYGFLSNFSRHPIQLHGHTWPTCEHYFQAQKFPGSEHEGAILRASSPTIAARMGRSRDRPLRPDWEQV